MATNLFNINTNIRKAIYLHQRRTDYEMHKVVSTLISIRRHADQLPEFLKVNSLDGTI